MKNTMDVEEGDPNELLMNSAENSLLRKAENV